MPISIYDVEFGALGYPKVICAWVSTEQGARIVWGQKSGQGDKKMAKVSEMR